MSSSTKAFKTNPNSALNGLIGTKGIMSIPRHKGGIMDKLHVLVE
jgi:hypothetical protein